MKAALDRRAIELVDRQLVATGWRGDELRFRHVGARLQISGAEDGALDAGARGDAGDGAELAADFVVEAPVGDEAEGVARVGGHALDTIGDGRDRRGHRVARIGGDADADVVAVDRLGRVVAQAVGEPGAGHGAEVAGVACVAPRWTGVRRSRSGVGRWQAVRLVAAEDEREQGEGRSELGVMRVRWCLHAEMARPSGARRTHRTTLGPCVASRGSLPRWTPGAARGTPPRVMIEPTIRPAREDDAPLLAAAERAIAVVPGQLVSRPEELLEERFAQKIGALARAENGRYLVAELDGVIVGHGLLDPLPLAAVRHVVHLTLAVHPGWQGRGVGRALLLALIAWARAAPAVGKIELHVRAPNERAQALYRSVGFVEVGRWRRRVQVAPGQYVDDVAMDLLVK